jgi:protein TonB
VSDLLRDLEGPDPASREAAAWALAGAGEVEAPVIKALVAALDGEAEPLREAAAWALDHLTSPAGKTAQLADALPRKIIMTRPKYPRAAFVKRIEGTVKLDIIISAAGSVSHAEVRESVPGLDEAALACVREWKFEPATRAGRAVPIAAQAPVSFRITSR